MRHEECGDVIRPSDCVLLRAGGKRNELPYVAKVAQLWENPEDGKLGDSHSLSTSRCLFDGFSVDYQAR